MPSPYYYDESIIIDKPTVAYPEITYPEVPLVEEQGEWEGESINGRIDENTQTEGQCFSIAETICNTDGFQLFCEALTMVGLIELLGSSNSNIHQQLTVFAPNDEAFEVFQDTSPPGKLTPDTLADLLSFHVVQEDRISIPSEELICNGWLVMRKGGSTFTHCRGYEKYQVGLGNSQTNSISLQDSPIIVRDNIGACNGIIHAIDKVMLPESW